MREYYCEKVILRKNKFPNYMHEKKINSGMVTVYISPFYPKSDHI